MYLLYIDESGDPNGWQSQKHFVLAGVAVFEGQVHNLTKQLDSIQASYFPAIPVPLAFHATDIRAGHNHFRNLHPSKREQLLDDLYESISTVRFPNLIAFATVMHISAAKNATQALRDTFEDIVQRFNIFLVRQYNAGYKNKGLLIIDRAREQRYRELVSDFHRSGTTYGYIGNIVDIPFFARRHDTRMLQLADLCANAVFRYYEVNDTKYFNKVLPRFDRRTPEHPPDGLKHLIHQSCSCQACSWRQEPYDGR